MQSDLLSEGKAREMFRRKTDGCGGKPEEGNLDLRALLQPLKQQSPEFNPGVQKRSNASSLEPCQRGFCGAKWRGGVIRLGFWKTE